MLTYSFWFGAFLFYFGMALLLAGLAHLFKRMLPRIIGVLAIALITAVLTSIVFRPAPLSEKVYLAGSGYSGGQVAAGITWGSGEGDLRVTLTNPTGRDYSGLDLTLQVGQDNQRELPQIMAISQLSSVPGVSFTSQPFPMNHVHLSILDLRQAMKLKGIGIGSGQQGISPRYLYGTNPRGIPLKVPTISSPEEPSPSFRIQVSKLPEHTTLKIIAAVAITNPPDLKGHPPKRLFAPFHAPGCVMITGSYTVLNRPIRVKDSCHVPKPD